MRDCISASRTEGSGFSGMVELYSRPLTRTSLWPQRGQAVQPWALARSSAASKPQAGDGVPPYCGQSNGEQHCDNGDIDTVEDVSEKAAFKKDIVIGAKVDLTDIQSEIGRFQKKLFQGFE